MANVVYVIPSGVLHLINALDDGISGWPGAVALLKSGERRDRHKMEDAEYAVLDVLSNP